MVKIVFEILLVALACFFFYMVGYGHGYREGLDDMYKLLKLKKAGDKE